jgi:hypothetical protein
MTVTFTPEQIEAIGYALDLAASDQEHYLDYGDTVADYGDDWKETAKFKALNFRLLGDVGELLGLHGERERWDNLAKGCEEIA